MLLSKKVVALFVAIILIPVICIFLLLSGPTVIVVVYGVNNLADGPHRIFIEEGQEIEIKKDTPEGSSFLLGVSKGEGSLSIQVRRAEEWVTIKNCGYFGEPLVYTYKVRLDFLADEKERVQCTLIE